MPSFYAKYWSTDPHKCLIGGVQQSQTSRFEREKDAQARLDQIIELTPHATGEVVKSNLPPEIFSHCPGSVPQAIGGKCFGCGKVITIQDVQENSDHNALLAVVIDGLREYHRELHDPNRLAAIHGKVTVHNTGDHQHDYEDLRDEIEGILDTE